MGKPPFIPARNFTRGRIAPVDVLVLHTAEGARDVTSLGRWFQTDYPGSAHSGVDDHGRADYVRFTDTAWGAPGANADGEHLEMCGFAAWPTAVWLDLHSAMLDQAAAWLAERSQAHGIPLNFLSPTDLLAKRRGFTTHANVTAAWHLSTHTDPGANFPVEVVRERAAALLRKTRKVGPVTVKPKPVTVTPTPVPKLARTLTVGARGVDVVALQRRLIARGWSVARDGVYGPATAAAVAAFQRHAHLTADGVCGPITWRALWTLRVAPPATRAAA